jgi:hypothetical protein
MHNSHIMLLKSTPSQGKKLKHPFFLGQITGFTHKVVPPR